MELFTSIYLGTVALSLMTFLSVNIALAEPLKKKTRKNKQKKQMRDEIGPFFISVILPITNLCIAGILVNDMIRAINSHKKEAQERDLFNTESLEYKPEPKKEKSNISKQEKLYFLKSERDKLTGKIDESPKKYSKTPNKKLYMVVLLGLFIALKRINRLH